MALAALRAGPVTDQALLHELVEEGRAVARPALVHPSARLRIICGMSAAT